MANARARGAGFSMHWCLVRVGEHGLEMQRCILGLELLQPLRLICSSVNLLLRILETLLVGSSTHMAKGEYKLARQIRGRGAFAHVSVLVGPTVAPAADVTAADSIESFPDWINAATGACARILEVLRTQGIASKTTGIVITSLVGTYVDTTTDAIEAASVLAVASAFGLLEEMALHYDERWHVDWSSKNVRAV